MMLLGNSKFAGYFYLISMITGFVLLLRVRILDLGFSRPVLAYFLVIAAFLALYGVQVLFTAADASELDTFSRLALGAVNGAFFTAFLGRNNRSVFLLIVLIALLHACVSMGTAFLETLLTHGRARGSTNPIPFSEVLAVSAGIAVIAAVSYRQKFKGMLFLPALAVFLALALTAVILTGSRGTLVVVFPLAILMAAALEVKPRPVRVAAAVGVMLGLMVVFSPFVFSRMGLLLDDVGTLLTGGGIDGLSASVRVRIDLWLHALQLGWHSPIFGHGVGSFPEVLKDPSLNIPADSPLWRFNHVHNQYLDVLLETGLVGLVLFFLLIAIPLIEGVRALRDPSRRAMGSALIWVASSYAIFGLSTTFMAHVTTSHQFGVYLGILLWSVAYRGDDDWTLAKLIGLKRDESAKSVSAST